MLTRAQATRKQSAVPHLSSDERRNSVEAAPRVIPKEHWRLVGSLAHDLNQRARSVRLGPLSKKLDKL
jgi:hypothetical protein